MTAIAHTERRVPPICLVGPLPPPSGGMANQCEQLIILLRSEGVDVQLVRTNAPYRPALVGAVPGLRALFRLIPYVADLWRATGSAGVVHVLANSGWAWHLFSAPALTVAWLRGKPVVVNYRGGEADAFLARAPGQVHWQLRRAALLVTPSVFLQRVFARHGLNATVIPNIIDLTRFRPVHRPPPGDTPAVASRTQSRAAVRHSHGDPNLRRCASRTRRGPSDRGGKRPRIAAPS